METNIDKNINHLNKDKTKTNNKLNLHLVTTETIIVIGERSFHLNA